MNHEDILRIITAAPGYEIGLFGILVIYRLENGKYTVIEDPTEPNAVETLFDDPEKAVAKFMEVREARKLGYDFETVSSN